MGDLRVRKARVRTTSLPATAPGPQCRHLYLEACVSHQQTTPRGFISSTHDAL